MPDDLALDRFVQSRLPAGLTITAWEKAVEEATGTVRRLKHLRKRTGMIPDAPQVNVMAKLLVNTSPLEMLIALGRNARVEMPANADELLRVVTQLGQGLNDEDRRGVLAVAEHMAAVLRRSRTG